MSVFDIDVASRRSPDSIRNKEFARIRRGYDPDQVQDYLNQIAGWIDQLEKELRQARTELATMSRRRIQTDKDPYERLGNRVAEILRTAEQYAEQTRREAAEEVGRQLSEAKERAERQVVEAKDRAEKQLTESRTEAERVRREAKSEAQRLRVAADAAIVRARTEAEALLANLVQRRDALLTELHSYRERLMGLVGQLEPVMKSPGSLEQGGEQQGKGQAPPPAAPVPPPPKSLTEPFDRQRFEELMSGGGETPAEENAEEPNDPKDQKERDAPES
jgi:DivIVA domain-containing protein